MFKDDYEDFQLLDNIEKSSYVLGSGDLWKSKFDGLLSLVKEYIVDMWEIQKHKLYDSDMRILSTTSFSIFTWGSGCD